MGPQTNGSTNGQPRLDANGRPVFNGEELQRFENIVANVSMLREELFSKLFDPRRDIERECGYPHSTTSITPQEYQDLYDRESVAARFIEVMPKESWQVQPSVYESKDIDINTPFEMAWSKLGQALRRPSWFQDQKGNPVWDYLLRADILCGIGRFGILLLGINDGESLEKPIGGAITANSRYRSELLQLIANERPKTVAVKNAKGDTVSPEDSEKSIYAGVALHQHGQMVGTDAQYVGPFLDHDEVPPERREGLKLLYMRPFPESLVQVVQYESNMFSPRFGQPIRYLITLNDPREERSGIGLPTASIYVHWSRVIHLAETNSSSDVFAIPRLQPVLNRMLDLRKLYAASAEMYWRGAFPGLSLETNANLGGDVNIDQAATRKMMDAYSNSLQRYLALSGMTAKMLAPTVSDPSQQISAQLQAICLQIGIPQRIFLGSERGNLASSQDDSTWNDRLRHRQLHYITPRIIIPFVDRLIAIGVLPEPKGYSISWPSLTLSDDKALAQVAQQKTIAMAQYVNGGVQALMTPRDYMTVILGMDDLEVQYILEATAEEQAIQQAMQQQQAEQQAAAAVGQPPPPDATPPPASKTPTVGAKRANEAADKEEKARERGVSGQAAQTAEGGGKATTEQRSDITPPTSSAAGPPSELAPEDQPSPIGNAAVRNHGIIAVDLDGTLAKRETPFNKYSIGEPILERIEKVKIALQSGKKVVIFTARIGDGKGGVDLKVIKLIKAWCKKYLGQELEVTNVKGKGISQFIDDRANQVVPDGTDFPSMKGKPEAPKSDPGRASRAALHVRRKTMLG